MNVGILLRLGPGRTLPLVMREAARIGADGIQLYVRHNSYDLLALDAAGRRQFKTDCRDLDLELPALCGELGGHGFQCAAENPPKIATMRQIIDLASELECPVVSTHIGVVPVDSGNEVYKVMLDAMSGLGEYAKKGGVTLAIETGPERPDALRRFIAGTNGGVGVNFDPANLAMVQNIDAAEAARELGPYIVHTHAKDGVHLRDCDPVRVYEAFAVGGFKQLEKETGELFREVPLGEGQVNFPRYLSALAATGYDGYLTIEREVGNDPERDMLLAVNYLRKILSRRDRGVNQNSGNFRPASN